MKRKCEGKCSNVKYLCEECDILFEGKPFASIDMSLGLHKSNLCSNSCYNAFIGRLKEGVEDDIKYFIDTELEDLKEILSKRADYKLILKILSERIALAKPQIVRSWQMENEK